jgi:5-methylcytosine-specific restriction endonuclease McrA
MPYKDPAAKTANAAARWARLLAAETKASRAARLAAQRKKVRRYREKLGAAERSRRNRKLYQRNAEARRAARLEYHYRRSADPVYRAKEAARAARWYEEHKDQALAGYTAQRAGARVGFVSASEIRKVFSTFKHRCAVCGARRPLELDHRKPLSRGGRHTVRNLQVLCKGCNSRKGNRRPWSLRAARKVLDT